ncbi:Argininosuccinate lyase (plasmid) [Variovorax sp. SRS16]|uniref:Bug family tripartite tricarboxylate transporter substrate binding protein n=1 Tax=Variovorax sp. SRS16 TaxID=282217 RepID=UPI001317AB52|nr:tripartite tricarboxylate transporter substrate-binding protein [Variovorax sp. SRS16]VTU45894.1 Argininosuccinate lyase [Variovorax sp. SRS16]
MARVFLSKHVRSLLLACAAVAALPAAQAQTPWPSARPITLIVPFTAGGGTDAIARMVGQKLGARLGQAVVIENVGGGGGTIGTAKAVAAASDGYTILLGVDSPLLIAKLLNPRAVRYDAFRDLTPIGLVSTSPMVLMARPGLAANTLPEVIALAKAKPGKLTYATSGIGTILHLGMERLKQQSGIDVTHVPYRGGAQALTDLMGDQVDLALLTTGSALAPVTGRKVKGVVLTDDKRLSTLPDVPALSEFKEFKGMKLLTWIGLYAPERTPGEIVSRLNKELDAVLQAPDVRSRLSEQGALPGGGTPEEFGAFVRSEQPRYEDIVKSADIHE